MQILPIRNDFSPQFYEEFARLVVAFGRIEYLIKLCIKDLLAEGFTKGMTEAELAEAGIILEDGPKGTSWRRG